MKHKKLLSVIGLLSVAGAAAAADAPSAPSLSQVLESSGIAASGYVSSSYYHLSSDMGSFHQFDVAHNTFAIDQAALTLAFQPKSGFGALVNVIAGQDAKAINGAEDPGNSGTFNVTQAYVQYAGGPVTVMAGKFLTLAGAEVIASTGNNNYSRSLLFTNLEPLTHTGLRVAVAPNDKVSFTLGVNNGWNYIKDNNTQKTFEGNVTVAPSAAFSIGLTGYFGNESDNMTGITGAKNLIDLVATWHVSDAVTLALNYDNLRVKDVPAVGTKKSDGFALYGNFAFNDQWRLAVRLEQMKDDSTGLLTSTDSGKEVDSQTEVALQAFYKF